MSSQLVLEKDIHYRFPHLLVLEASAGSGKTDALASRYVQFILASEDKIPHNDISNILAITFTNKASKEMRERILNRLKCLALEVDEKIRNQTLELLSIKPEELQTLAWEMVDRIIEGYSDFQIQTIDSFTNQVINSAALEMDLRPNMKITLTYDELLDYALSLILRQVGPGRNFEVTRKMDEFVNLINQTSRSRFIWNPGTELQNTFEKFLEVESKETGKLTFKDHRQEIQQCLESIKQSYQEIMSVPLEKKKNDKFTNALAEGNIAALLKKTYSSNTVPIYKTMDPKDRKELFEQAERKWLDLNPVVAKMAKFYSLSRYHAFGEVYHSFTVTLDIVKLRTGSIHIDDIGKKLSQYLREENIPEVYLWLGQKIYHYLIDEFQDTDPIQWKSLYLLISESLAKEGSLFLVGDLKQAIYMFRRADYRIMRELIQDIRGGGPAKKWLPPSVQNSARVNTLDINYRSGEVILKYVEEVFKNKLKALVGTDVLPQDLTGLTDFEQRALDEKKGVGYVWVKRFHKLQSQEENSDLEPERKVLLDIISDVRSRGYHYQDIAILSSRNIQLETIVDWLTAAGIPASSSSSLDIRKRKVVAEIVELLKFLDSPVDDLAFANFVGSDIMAKAAASDGIRLGTGEVCQLILKSRSQASRHQYLYQSFREDKKFRIVWEKYFNTLYQKTGYYPLYDLVSLALKTFKVFENTPEESASLVKLLEVVNSLESRGQNSIRDFLEQMAEEQEELFYLELPEYSDSVQLLTFHKSKGLGFPVVINIIYETGRPSDSMYYDKTGDEIKVYYLTKDFVEKNSDLREIYERRKVDEQIQQLNTLYVICTRAKSELYNLVILKKEDGLFSKLFEERELGQKTLNQVKGEAKPAVFTSVRLPEGKEPEIALETGKGWSYSRWSEVKEGKAYHRILEEIEFLSEPLVQEISSVVDRCKPLLEGTCDPAKIKADLVNFFSQSEVKDWFNQVQGRKVFRESEYVDQSGYLYRMDRVIVDDDRVTVIDYKTGEPADYSVQVKKYMNILGQVYSGKKNYGYIAYVDSCKVQEIK